MSQVDREHIRLRMDTKVFVELAAADPHAGTEAELLKCDVIDVSFGGLKARIAEELIQDSILSIAVFIPGVDEPFYLAAEVRWCRPDDSGEGTWCAGFQILVSSGSDVESWRDLLTHV